MPLVALILLGCLVALVYGWFHSARTRRLARAALIIVAALIILVALGVLIERALFPLQF